MLDNMPIGALAIKPAIRLHIDTQWRMAIKFCTTWLILRNHKRRAAQHSRESHSTAGHP
jgi:hypothetical protein